MFKNKQNIYLSPYSSMTLELEKYLKNIHDISIKGYIDNSKIAKNIYKPSNIKNLDIHNIFILSPNWDNEIYKNLSHFTSKKHLTMLVKDNKKYKKSILNIAFIRAINKISISIINNLLDYFNIKIVKLWTNRIGEFSLESEAFLNKIKFDQNYKNKKFIVLSYINEQEIANKTLYDLYRIVFKRFKNIILLEDTLINKYLQFCLINKSISSKHYYSIEQKSNAYELFINKAPIIEFSKSDIEKGNKIFQEMNLKKPFVCIFARDSQYLQEKFKYHDWSYHDYRDADINTYELAIQYLIENGYSIVRIGSIANQELKFKHSKCIDYPYSNFQSEFMDIFLISQCSFAIGGHSGILDICNAFSKVRLGVNNMPIDAPNYSTKDDIYIPKKIKKDGQYISLNKYFNIIQDSKLSHFEDQTYQKLDFEIQNNSPQEILILVKEYIGDYKYTEEDLKNLKKYHKIHSKSKQFSSVKTKIGTQFLRDNPWFIN